MNVEQEFEANRPLMFSIAYRMLGSAMEAEDMVQEAFLRYQAVTELIASPKAYLCTIVTRLCLNFLQSARVQREVYPGPWLPEPLHTGEDSGFMDQGNSLESISLAFLVLLESLTPTERAVFLLREVFDFEYVEIAHMVGKDEGACRQLFSRAKKHIADHRPRFQSTPQEHRRILERFIEAARVGDLDGLTQLLTEDVTLWGDGGGKVRGAATRPVVGIAAVAQFALGSLRFIQGDFETQFAEINGQQAAVLRSGGSPLLVLSIDVQAGKIATVRAIGNPDKLRRV